MIVALITSYGDRGYLPGMLSWLETSGQVDAVELLQQDQPLGCAAARKQLIDRVTARYGYDHYYLILDDDCLFDNRSNIRRAASLIDNEPDIGIVSFPLSGILGHGYIEALIVKHAFLTNGALFQAGVNYTPGEHYDSADLCIQSYLAGYRNVVTREAFIWHDVNPGNSVREQLKHRAEQSGNTNIYERYKDYIERYDPPYWVMLNDKAQQLHNQNNAITNGTVNNGNIQ